MKGSITGLFAVMIFMLLSCIAPVPAFGNAGPTFWRGYPSSEILVIDENCPIEVEREDLIFDLRGDHRSEHTIKGRVTASYEMVNPTDETLSVQMAFPWISSLDHFSRADTVIEADGEPLPFELYIGDMIDGLGAQRLEEDEVKMGFEELVSAITKKTYLPKSFAPNEKGTLHCIKVNPTTEKGVNLAIDFTYDKEKTKLLTGGFNSFRRDGGNVHIAAWCYKPETLKIIVLGQDIDFAFQAYTDGQLKEKTDLFTCEVVTEEIELMPFIMEYVAEEKAKTMERLPEQGLYNIYAEAIDKDFLYNDGFSIYPDILQQNYYDRVFTALYTVDFAADSSRKVTVAYETIGAMDRSKTVEPVYTFNYILNPASKWGNFKDLNIDIFTPKEAPFVLDSNIELTKKDEGHYLVGLDSLPDRDFVFSIHANERVNPLDRVQIFFHGISWFFFFFGIPILVLIAIGVVVYTVVKGRQSI